MAACGVVLTFADNKAPMVLDCQCQCRCWYASTYKYVCSAFLLCLLSQEDKVLMHIGSCVVRPMHVSCVLWARSVGVRNILGLVQ